MGTQVGLAPPFPWQARQWQQVTQSLEQGRMPHALLLVGPKGVGKRQFAERLCQIMLCEHHNACDQCPACLKYRNHAHPDYRVLGPEEGKRDISIDSVRNSLNYIQLSAQVNMGWKILNVDPADHMTVNAANAFLKTLEEPPARRLLLLVADRLHRVPVTIRSRCRILRFQSVSSQASAQWLDAQGLNCDAALLRQCDNSPLTIRDRLTQGDGASSISDRLWRTQLAHCLTSGRDILETAEKWDEPELSQDICTWLQSEILTAMRQALNAQSVAEDNAFQTAGMGSADILKISNSINYLPRILGTNQNRRLIWETFLLECHRIRANSCDAAP